MQWKDGDLDAEGRKALKADLKIRNRELLTSFDLS